LNIPRLDLRPLRGQGSQFTSVAFTNTLREAGIRISMDGRGRWMDNVFIERL
jgi:putative transposase